MTQRRIKKTTHSVTVDGAKNGTRLVPAKTVLVVVRGMSLAKEFRVSISERELTFNQDIKALSPKNTLDPSFLFYYLLSQSQAIKDSASEAAHGTKKVDMPVLENWPLPLPPRTDQEKIAAILSLYDDLIESNQRRIALLEKMAEEIYREWFVRMRFPGHKQVKFEKGIPRGWDTDKACEFFDVVKGKSYGSDELTENTQHMPFITLKSFNRGGGYREDGLKYYSGSYKEDQVVFLNDVVMAVTDMTQDRVVVGRVARVPNLGSRGAVISLDVIKLAPKKMTGTFLYSYMRHSGFADFIKEFANGANVLHLKPDLVAQQKIIVPTKSLQEEFSKIVEPIYEKIDVISMANKQMTTIRDMLLPRLISGKFSVEALDIQFPPSMQESGHDQ
ncbi:MAG: hypothetical protein A3I66_05015 [Burkholderiales bacterium RIFCSPLOWO2_02_FULL_57_36]|nr:MAG: hypothetical protein A3I66_05015 [Burkholderiales bacterium RIFCSPLOWO2_02_FULL_57_36]